MRKFLILIVPALLCLSQSSFAWGKMGHDAIAYIAECNLTPKAKANIAKYLDHSIVYYTSWVDEYRKTKEYGFIDKWHTGRVDKDLYSTKQVRRENGDCVREVENAIERLKNYKNLSDSTVNVNLKYIIHLVGDMHCPSHIDYGDPKRFNVTLKGVKMSYHALWDSGVLNAAHVWGFMEYQQQLDRYSAKQKREMSKGTPAEWFHQSAVDCQVIYDWAQAGDVLGTDFVNKAHYLPEQQIVKAGYRLARVLNELFG